ncbi:MAG TPA: four helix bundle protein [Opitutaceae bacterium]|nr:four helix bundle protein [Opitutaceae bacterium]
MSPHSRFEDLPVWQSAARLYDGIDAFLDRNPPRLRPGFRSQLDDAALAVANLIAGGFERGSVGELVACLRLALGAAGEVRSMLILAGRNPGLARFRFEIAELKSLADSCARQIRTWAASLPPPDGGETPSEAAGPAGEAPHNGPPGRSRSGRLPPGSCRGD